MNLRSLTILVTLSSLYACGEVSTLGTGMDSGGTGGRDPDQTEGKETEAGTGSGGTAGTGGKASGEGNAPSHGGTGTAGEGGTSAGASPGAGGNEEEPEELCQDTLDTNQGADPPAEEECEEIGTALEAAYDAALDGAELTVTPLAGTWVTGSGPQRIELVLDAQGKGTLLFGEPTALPEISDPEEPYLTNRDADDAEDLLGLGHLKRYPGFPYTVVSANGQGSEMSFHILVMETWDSWCQLQAPVASASAHACYACMGDDRLYSIVDDASSCDAPEGCYAGESLNEEDRVHCGRFELCLMPHHSVCNCNSDGCFANLAATGQLTVYPYELTLDPVDTTILRLKSLSELEEKKTYYLQKQQ